MLNSVIYLDYAFQERKVHKQPMMNHSMPLWLKRMRETLTGKEEREKGLNYPVYAITLLNA